MSLVSRISKQLQIEEGVRTRLYRDTVGKLTIGVGRNIEDVGITPDEAELMLSNDINRTLAWLAQFDWFAALDEVRQAVVVDLTFNIGQGGLLHFPKFLAAMHEQNWAVAARELRDSKWHDQVGSRAIRLESMVNSGEWAPDIPYE